MQTSAFAPRQPDSRQATVAAWGCPSWPSAPLPSSVVAHTFACAGDLERFLQTRRFDAVITPAGIEGVRSIDAVLTVASRRGIGCPIVADMPTSHLAYEHLAQLLRAGLHVRPVLRGLGDGALADTILRLPRSR